MAGKKPRVMTILSAAVMGAALLGVSAYNLFQPDRATESVSEQRALAEFPDFSWDALFDGSYFSGIEQFLSDTFPHREELVLLSGKITRLYGGILTDTGRDITVLKANVGQEETQEIEMPELTLPPKRETDSPVTETDPPAVTAETSAPEEESSTQESETQPSPDAIHLSAATLMLSPGEQSALRASVEPAELDGVRISWTSSDHTVVSIRAEEDHLVVEALKAGSALIYARCGDAEASCKVTVAPPIVPVEGDSRQIITNEPEFLTSGLIIYGDAVYGIPYLSEKNARNYATAADYLAQLFDVKVSTLVAPLSSAMLDLDTFGNRLTDQNQIIDTIASYNTERVNGVNCFPYLWEHRDQYLYFKTDHHWTGLGAYYAYQAFVESVGLEAAPLDSFDKVTLTEDFHGTMNAYTNYDERVAKIADTIDAYLSRKKHTMTIYKNGVGTEYNHAIQKQYRNYGAFILGDNAYTVINVPENPQDCNILVFKDSYGNALVPYLVENYGNIIVIDPRYVSFNVYELLKDYPLRDILLVNHIYNPNTASCTLNLLRSVGAEK